MARCVLFDRECSNCGACERCPRYDRICINCFECLEEDASDADYAKIEITGIVMNPEKSNESRES